MKLARSSDKRLRSSSIDMPDNLGRRSGESSRTPSTGKAPDRPRDQGLPRPFRGQKGGLIPKQDALNQSRPVGRVPAMLLRIRTEVGIAHPGLAATAVTSPLCKSLTSTMLCKFLLLTSRAAAGRARFCAGRTPWRGPRRCAAHGPNISARSKPSASPLPHADGVITGFKCYVLLSV
jgi:hypothetical protein